MAVEERTPDWPTLDLRHAGPEGAASSFEACRSVDFRFEGSSSYELDAEPQPAPPAEDDERIISSFWSAAGPEPADDSLPRFDIGLKPTGPRRPEIPGYEILGELGRGAMGVVYKARQVRLNRIVAIKMILAGDHASPTTLARFITEAETIARLKHPYIVQIYAISDCEGRPYVELEYVEGGSLASRLDGTPWSPRSAARLVESLARAAAEAHRLGIVHRDLKPANILMTEAGEPKISDFGLAKSLGEDTGLTRTESILGSPNYMAPEQADGRSKDVGPVGRYLCPGREPLRVPDRPPAVRGPHHPRDPRSGQELRSGPASEAPAAPRSRPRDDLPEMPGEGAPESLQDRRRPGRRPRGLSRGRADPGPAILGLGAGPEVGPKASIDGRHCSW